MDTLADRVFDNKRRNERQTYANALRNGPAQELECQEPGNVQTTSPSLRLKITYSAGESISGYVEMGEPPEDDSLTQVDDTAAKLDEKRKQNFHTITARTLFYGKRARPDILT